MGSPKAPRLKQCQLRLELILQYQHNLTRVVGENIDSTDSKVGEPGSSAPRTVLLA